MTDHASGREDTGRHGTFRLLLGVLGALLLTFVGNVIAVVLFALYLIFLLVVSVIAGFVFDADVGLAVFLTAFGLSVIVPVVLGLYRYRRDHPEMFRNDLRDAVVAWGVVIVFALVVGGIIVFLLDLVTA